MPYKNAKIKKPYKKPLKKKNKSPKNEDQQKTTQTTASNFPAGAIRVQKLLANAGYGSRREIERWIKEGRISLNGKKVCLGDRARPSDPLFIDNRPVSTSKLQHQERRILIYNKPEGEIVSRNDPEHDNTVFQHLPAIESGRWINVGRLDINSSGLLIFTTDGELANRLMHPSRQIQREYAVRVMGEVTEEIVKSLVEGIELEDGKARFEEVTHSGGSGINQWFHVVLIEGRYREVRRLWDAVGLQVSRLKRVRFGPIFLNSAVKVGQWRELDAKERKQLLNVVELKDDKSAGVPL